MAKYKHILLATDLSSASKKAAIKAVELAKLFGAKLTLIYVADPIYANIYPLLKDLEDSVVDEIKKEVALLGKELNVPEENQKIKFGSVKACVLEIAELLRIDLIVLGSHGRHGLSRLLGSSASAIIHGAGCDVSVIRSGEQ